MSRSPHERFRREVIEGEMSPARVAHRAVCRTCARFADTFDRAVRTASLTAVSSTAPPDLVERVVARVREEATGGSPQPPRRVTLSRVRVALAAAGALALAALVLLAYLQGRSARRLLATAADRTEAERTARVTVEGTVTGQIRSGGVGVMAAAPGAFELAVEASGGAAWGDRLQIEGTVREVSGDAPIPAGSFNEIVTAERRYVLAPGGYREGGESTLVGQILRSPDTPLEILRLGARADVDRLGTAVAGAAPAERLRFRLPPGAIAPPFPSTSVSDWTVEAEIDTESNLLRGLTLSGDGNASGPTPMSWRLSLALDLSRFGGRVFRTDLPGTLVAGDDLLLPLAGDASLSTYAGRKTHGRLVSVESVVADEAFWVGSSANNRVLVVLRVRGESAPSVRARDLVSLRGRVVRNPTRLAADLGITVAEGAALLERQRYHVEVRRLEVIDRRPGVPS